MSQKLKFNHTREEIKKIIEDTFYQETIQPERSIKLWCWGEGAKMFDQAIKDEVKRLYGNNEQTDNKE